MDTGINTGIQLSWPLTLQGTAEITVSSQLSLKLKIKFGGGSILGKTFYLTPSPPPSPPPLLPSTKERESCKSLATVMYVKPQL